LIKLFQEDLTFLLQFPNSGLSVLELPLVKIYFTFKKTNFMLMSSLLLLKLFGLLLNYLFAIL